MSYECKTCELESYSTISSKTIMKPINGVYYYHIVDYTGDLTKQEVKDGIKAGYDKRADRVPGLRFEETTQANKAHMNHIFTGGPIAFGQYDIAYVLSGGKYQHDIFYNDKQDFDDLTLEIVVAHELGHVFGLKHNSIDNNSLMGPQYRPRGILTTDDVDGFLSRYEGEIKSDKEYGQSIQIARIILQNKRYIETRVSKRVVIKLLDYFGIPYNGSKLKSECVSLLCEFLDIR